MTSKIDQYSINEEDSRAIVSKFCRRNNWKYRKMEWDNDIDGEIEIFNKIRETTAKFIKVQLKTIDDPAKFLNKNTHYDFDAEIDFVNFCDVCDIPVILAVFNIHEEAGYFVFMQEYIYTVLDQTNPNWRHNKTRARIKIPFSNSFSKKESKQELIRIANKGVSQIKQLRKIDTSQEYYTVVKQGDNSNGIALRTSISILVERSFASSKDAMRILIPKILAYFRTRVYHRNETLAKRFAGEPYSVIYLNFYNDITQQKQGLPFCRVLWVDSQLSEIARPYISTPDESISDINIFWERNDSLASFLKENISDKGNYLPKVDALFLKISILFDKIIGFQEDFNSKTINEIDYISSLKSISNELEDLYESVSDIGLAPNECKDLDLKLNSLVATFHNLKLIANDGKRSESNIFFCIKMYLATITEELPEYKYERKKIN